MPLLGLDVDRAAVDALFDSWDTSGEGEITLRELNAQLRRGGEIELDERLRPGAAGRFCSSQRM